MGVLRSGEAVNQKGGTAGRGTEMVLGENHDNVQVMMFKVPNLSFGGIQKATEGTQTNDIWEAMY